MFREGWVESVRAILYRITGVAVSGGIQAVAAVKVGDLAKTGIFWFLDL